MKLQDYGPIAQAQFEVEAKQRANGSSSLLPLTLMLIAGAMLSYAWMLRVQENQRQQYRRLLATANQNH